MQLLSGFWHSGSLASSLTGEANFLSHHFQPIILLFSPIVAAFDHSTSLFGLAAATLFATYAVGCNQCRRFGFKQRLGALFLLATLVFHPAIAARAYYSFVPEIFALPFYLWMAFQIRFAPKVTKPTWTWWLALVITGLCKENLWLVNVAVCLAMYVQNRSNYTWLASAGINLLVFLLLFFWWMPAHTNMSSYYGLSFYLPDPSQMSLGYLTISLLQNLFSMQSLLTLFQVLAFFCFIPLVRLSWVLLPAAVSLGFVLVSHASQVHGLANQYLIPVFPFLAVAAIGNLAQLGEKFKRREITLFCLCSPLVALGYGLSCSTGVAHNIKKINENPYTEYITRDMPLILDSIPTDAAIVTSGTLQPHMAAYQNVHMMLGFQGNPVRLDDKQINKGFYAVLMGDILQVSDCRSATAGGENLLIDQNYFVKMCELMKSRAQLLRTFSDSKLYTYYIPPSK